MKTITVFFNVATISLFLLCGKDQGTGPNQIPPVVTAWAPDTVTVNDSITIKAIQSDKNIVLKYLWLRNSPFHADTTTIGSYKTTFPDTGKQLLCLIAIGSGGILSLPDSIVIFVKPIPIPPKVKAMAGTSVNINDSIIITATATDDGTVTKFAWAKSGDTYKDTTTAGSWKTAFSTNEPTIVRVKAMDNGNAWSLPDSCVINVTLDAPIVSGHRDTVVSKTMSVVIQVTARDTNRTGSIQKYFWDIGANGWDDSTTVPQKTFSNPAGGPIKVLWSVRDDDGVFSKQDMFTIRFNNPPVNPKVASPGKRSWIYFNYALGKGTLPLSLSASDTDGSTDTLTYTLFLGASAGSLKQVYSGKLALFNAPTIDSSAVVYWRLKATDIYGDSGVASDTFTSPLPSPPGMTLIASGTYQMGQVEIEEPVHSVTLSSFWMDTTEVTQADFQSLMGKNPSKFSSDAKQPVEMISWIDAAQYCNARSKRDGLDTVYAISSGDADFTKKGYRLPTEAEWEYACRAGTTTDFYFDSSKIDDYAWSLRNANETKPVAKKLKNAFGLYDMAGNVFEWCNDWYHNYDSATVTNPVGPAGGTDRVCRGGSYALTSEYLRSAYRSAYGPSVTNSAIGFRVVFRAP
jgi:formylglycine-generating enzyme required for sulfatase activity